MREDVGPFRLSIEGWAPQCKILYHRFHVMQRGAADGVLPLGEGERRSDQREDGAADEPMEEPDNHRTGELNRLFQLNRKLFQGSPAHRKLENLWNYCWNGPCSTRMDGSIELGSGWPRSRTGRYGAEASGWHPELLQDQGSLRGGRSREWKSSHADQPWMRL